MSLEVRERKVSENLTSYTLCDNDSGSIATLSIYRDMLGNSRVMIDGDDMLCIGVIQQLIGEYTTQGYDTTILRRTLATINTKMQLREFRRGSRHSI